MSTVTRQFHIGGMTCVNCPKRIEKALSGTPGVTAARADYNTGLGQVAYDPEVVSFDELAAVVERLDYQVLSSEPGGDLARTGSLLVIILSLFALLQHFGLLTLLVPSRLADSGMGYGMLFVTGLLTSVHCIAMCGGINLSQSLPDGTEARGLSAYKPSALYNLGRVVSYTVIGAALGFAGMLLGGGSGGGVPVMLQGALKIVAGLLMVVMGVNMLGLFPGLRKFALRMPGGLSRLGAGLRRFGPFGVGLLNGLMPCGPLQSMQIVALASGSPVVGGLSMLLFSLGTVPLMLGLGSLVSALGQRFTRAVLNVGAVLVAVLGLAMLAQGGSLTGMLLPDRLLLIVIGLSVFGLVTSAPYKTKGRRVAAAAVCAAVILGAGAGWHVLSRDRVGGKTATAMLEDGVQVVYSTLEPGGYPSIRVQAGVPVRWVIRAPEGSVNGCNYKMILRDLGLEHEFIEGDNVIEFTAPAAGAIAYSCWMGMLQGNIYVTD